MNSPPKSTRDPLYAAALRFLLELAAWIAIFLAFGAGATVIAIGVISILNVPGDKKQVIIPVPGALRLVLEVALALVGIYATYRVAGELFALAFALVWLVYLSVARERLLWLMRGARE